MSMNVDLNKLPDYLQGQRWFGSKGLPIKDVTLIEHATIDVPTDGLCAGPFTLAIVEVAYQLGAPERYQVHVCANRDGGVVAAFDSDDYCRELGRILAEQRSLATGSGLLRGETLWRTPRLASLSPAAPVRRLEQEQSNTSVVYNDQAILKVIRKVEPGTNPELEIGRFLLSHPGFRSAPALFGALQLEGPFSATLAVLHEYVPAESDGWKYVLARFRERPSGNDALLSEVSALGRTVGNLHLTLASDPGDPAFAPEPIQQEDLQRWSSSIIGELGVTFAEAEKRVPDLADLRDPLIDKAKRLARVIPSGKKIRVHGDLHLGQVLRVRGDWMLFDFEGEPARTFSQRREKVTPMKDVAGMLRSLTYAQAAAELEGTAGGDWATPCRRAFLQGYAEATAASDLLPSKEAFGVVLDAFELEKTAYELRYELRSRPDWVRIPVHTLRQMGKAA